MTDVCVLLYITAAGNFISSQLGSSFLGKQYSTGKVGSTARPSHHVHNGTCRVTLLQPARRASLLGQPSNLRPHWYSLSDNSLDQTERIQNTVSSCTGRTVPAKSDSLSVLD